MSKPTNDVDEPEQILFAYQRWVADGFGDDLRLPGKRLTHKEALAKINRLIVEARANERERMQYHIDGFVKELDKGRIIDIQQELKDAIIEPHNRRVRELKDELQRRE